jgi:glycine/serine hydroxymethyltransferase
MKEPEMKLVGEWIAKVIHSPDDAGLKQKIRGETSELCKKFVFY